MVRNKKWMTASNVEVISRDKGDIQRLTTRLQPSASLGILFCGFSRLLSSPNTGVFFSRYRWRWGDVESYHDQFQIKRGREGYRFVGECARAPRCMLPAPLMPSLSQTNSIFNSLLFDTTADITLSAHKEIKRGRADCGRCGMKWVIGVSPI